MKQPTGKVLAVWPSSRPAYRGLVLGYSRTQQTFPQGRCISDLAAIAGGGRSGLRLYRKLEKKTLTTAVHD